MDNFDFLNKKELSFILNNEPKFGSLLIQQVEDYCTRKQFSIPEIKEKKQEWDEDFNSLSFGLQENKLIITKTEEAKKELINLNYLVKVIIGIMLLGCLWIVFTREVYTYDFFLSMLGVPILTWLLFGLFKQGDSIKDKADQKRELEIAKPNLVQLLENDQPILEEKIKAINLFWKEDVEIGSRLDASLEIKLVERKSILIFTGGNYLELFRCGNEMSKFIGVKLNLVYGNSPIKDKIEL